MIITGPHGIDEDKPSSSVDRIWAQVELGQGNTPIPKGSLCQWDYITDATIGSTRGLRVIICPTTAYADGSVAHAGLAYKAMPARAGARGEVGLLLIYGYMADVPYDNTNGDLALPLAPILPSDTTAGSVRTLAAAGAPAALESTKIVGFTFSAFLAGATGTNEVFVKCMG